MNMEANNSATQSNQFILNEPCSNKFTNPFLELKNLRKRLCFNGYYIAFLLGQITEKEFKKISKSFFTKDRMI